MKKSRSSGRVAVLVPLYKQSFSISEEFSFRNTLEVLGRHDIYVIGPEKLEIYLEQYKQKTGLHFRVTLFENKFFDSINGYNNLLVSENFYEKFSDYEYILIAQTDALVFSDQLEAWCDKNYSYVGAPWFVGFDKPQKPLTFLGVGNGGFSLRKVSDFIQVLSTLRYIPTILIQYDKKKHSIFYKLLYKFILKFVFSYKLKPSLPRVNEDAFWGMLVPLRYKYFTVPAIEDAISFAFEVEPNLLFDLNHRQLPFGCHAWERYDKRFWEQVMSERGVNYPKSTDSITRA